MRHWKLRTLLWTAALFVVLAALSQVLGRMDYLFTQLVLIGLVLILLGRLFYELDTTNRQVTKFLYHLQHRDFSLHFPETSTTGTYRELYKALNIVLQSLEEQQRTEREQQTTFRLILERLPYGVLLLRGQEVQYINPQAQEWLQQESLAPTLPLPNRSGIVAQRIEWDGLSAHQLYGLYPRESDPENVEMEAWLKLIRVLTHEIMNSTTAITSLAATTQQLFQTDGTDPATLQTAIDRIKDRSEHLTQFVDTYRSISAIKAAEPEWLEATVLLDRVVGVLGLTDIVVQQPGLATVQWYADAAQLEQVLINLLLNAQAAVAEVEQPQITLQFQQEGAYDVLQLIDNGKGIEPVHQNQIFVPFFSTREGGKGIGLSLCRQLMWANQGAVALRTSVPGHTVFELRWPSHRA